MGFADYLGDSNSGLLAAAVDTAKTTALAKTQDSNVLHPALQALLGTANATPSAGTPTTGPSSAVASLPKTDAAAGGAPTFVSKYKWALIAGGALVALVVAKRFMR